jgi:hypothetical protein
MTLAWQENEAREIAQRISLPVSAEAAEDRLPFSSLESNFAAPGNPRQHPNLKSQCDLTSEDGGFSNG